MHGPLFSSQAHVSGCTYLPTYCDGICQSFDVAQRGDSLVCGSRNPGSGRVVLRRSFCMQFGEITGGWDRWYIFCFDYGRRPTDSLGLHVFGM